MENQKLKNAVMRRVYFIYAVRKIANLTTFEVVAIGVFLSVISPFMPFVSLENVFANMPEFTNLNSLILFHESAIMNTEPVVQVALLVFLAAIVALVYSWITRTREKTQALAN